MYVEKCWFNIERRKQKKTRRTYEYV